MGRDKAIREACVWAVSAMLMLACSWAAWAGTTTSNEFIYKPGLGARGTAEKSAFDAGMERVDARLGKEIWVGDPKYGATIQSAVMAIGANQSILRVPAGVWTISDKLIIPANITFKLERGAVLNVTTSPVDIAAMTRANPCQITWTGHGLVTGDKVYLSSITQDDWVQLRNLFFTITKVDNDHFTIPVNTSAYAADYNPAVDPGTCVKVLDIRGGLEAGPHQVFQGTDGGVDLHDATIPHAYAQWWGAVGDGVHDDTSAINAALGAVHKTFLLEGTYLFTNPIAIRNSNTELAGAGFATILKSGVSQWTNLAIFGGLTNVRLRNFTIQGNISTESPHYDRAITIGTLPLINGDYPLEWDAYCLVENVRISGETATSGFNFGIMSNIANHVTVRGCEISHIYGYTTPYGVGINAAGKYLIIDSNRVVNVIPNQGQHGIYLGNGDYSTISNNIVANFTSAGINLNGNSSHGKCNSVTGNIVSNTGRQPWSDGGICAYGYNANLLVANNVIENQLAHGISIQFTTGGVISNNAINGCNNNGIWLNRVDSLIISGNCINSPGNNAVDTWNGIGLNNGSNNCLVVNNSITAGTNRLLAGINIDTGAPIPDYNVIANNYCKGSMWQGEVRNGNVENNTKIILRNEQRIYEDTSGSTTPSVDRNIRILRITNSGPVTVTNLINCYEGQVVTLIFSDSNTTLSLSGNFWMPAPFTSKNRNTISFVRSGGQWYETSRTMY